MANITATADSVGNWGSAASNKRVAENWNAYVAPVLAAFCNAHENDPSCRYEDTLAHAADIAWQAFCDGGTVKAAKKAATIARRYLGVTFKEIESAK
jgi:hypothetical protein